MLGFGRKRTRRTSRARLGARRRKILLLHSILVVMALVVVVVIISWVTRLEQATIQDIRISGNNVIQTEVIKEKVEENLEGSYFYLIPRRHALTYPQNEIMQSVRDISPRIQSVSVGRDNLQLLTVRVQEREPHALWCDQLSHATSTEAPCFYLDEFGFIFARSPSFTGNAFFKYYGELSQESVVHTRPIGAQFMPSEQFRGLNLFFTSFQELGLQPVALTRRDAGDVELVVADGSKIIFNTEENLATLLDNLESVLASEAFSEREGEVLEYIDLRFGNKVFYKFKQEREENL